MTQEAAHPEAFEECILPRLKTADIAVVGHYDTVDGQRVLRIHVHSTLEHTDIQAYRDMVGETAYYLGKWAKRLQD